MNKVYLNEYKVVYCENDFRILVSKDDLKNNQETSNNLVNNTTFDVNQITYDEDTNSIDKKKLSFQIVVSDLDEKMLDFIKTKQKTFIGVLDEESLYDVFEAEYVA